MAEWRILQRLSEGKFGIGKYRRIMTDDRLNGMMMRKIGLNHHLSIGSTERHGILKSMISVFCRTEIRHLQARVRIENAHQSGGRELWVKKKHPCSNDDVDFAGAGQREKGLRLCASPDDFTIHSRNPDVREIPPQ